jgi:hypothetical protein
MGGVLKSFKYMLLPTVLLAFCLLGFVFAAHRYLRLPWSFAPFFCVMLLGVLQYVFAITGVLAVGTWLAIALGWGLFIVTILQALYRKSLGDYLNTTTLILLSLFIITYLLSSGLFYRGIDEYSFWGPLSKSIFLHDRLPDSDTVIYPRHLSYTPGLALLHYFVYQFYGYFTQSISYFAQSLPTIAALLVITHQRDTSWRIIFIISLAFLVSMFFGSILTKLMVDYLLALCFFSGLWIWFSHEKLSTRLWCVLPVLPGLFLIKEAGLLLASVLALIIAIDLIQQYWRSARRQALIGLACLGLTLSILLFVKLSWFAYVQAQGFAAFTQGVGSDSLWQAFNIFSVDTRAGMKLFLSHLLFAHAEKIFTTPYLLWYLLLGLLWLGIFKRLDDVAQRQRYGILLGLLLAGFVIYVFGIYLLQVAVFKVGTEFDSPLALARYLNIYFIGWVAFSIYKYIDLGAMKPSTRYTSALACVLAVSFVGAMAMNKMRLIHKTQASETIIQQQAETILANIQLSEQHNICIISDNDKDDVWIKLRFLFYLLPQRSNYTEFPTYELTLLTDRLALCDYLFIHSAERATLDNLNLAAVGAYRVGDFYQVTQASGLTLDKIAIDE